MVINHTLQNTKKKNNKMLQNKQNIFYPLFRVVIWMETFHPNGLIKTFLLIWEEKKMITLDEHILEKK